MIFTTCLGMLINRLELLMGVPRYTIVNDVACSVVAIVLVSHS